MAAWLGRERERPGDGTAKAECYERTSRGLTWRKPTQHGTAPTRLTNFTAQIESETVRDDGTETRVVFDIHAEQVGRSRRGRVAASAFAAMRRPIELLGAGAIIYPNQGEQARGAIQTLSTEIRRRHAYTHTGWREELQRFAIE